MSKLVSLLDKSYEQLISNSDNIMEMSSILRFLINGKHSPLITDDRHPTFSFVVDFEKDDEHLDSATLLVNGHAVDVKELTHYVYQFDDLKPLTTYEASLEVSLSNRVSKKVVTFETGLFKWDSPFISDPNYTFKEKRVSPKVMSFKKNVELNKEIKRARLFVTAFGVYNVYVNNQKVNDTYFAPGFTSYKHQLQYQTYDITSLLRKDNELLFDVAGGWAVGSYVMNRVNRVSENKQSLSFKIIVEYKNGEQEIIDSDESVLVTTDTPYIFADLYDGEGYDANKKRDNYHKSCIYKTRCHPQVLADYGAPVIVKKALKPTYSHALGGGLIYDLKQNVAGVVSFKVKNAKQGQKIIIKHAEVLNNDKSLNTKFLRSAKCEIDYICKEGEQTYSPTFTYMGFRYLSIEGIEQENIDIEVLVLSSDNLEISTFECDNKLINRLNENIYWSSIANFMDIPTDCPQRDERMGWTGDIAIFASTALYNFELSAFLNKWLLDLRKEQLKSGGVPNTIPNQGFGFPITMPKMAIDFWGDAALMVPYALYQATGDKQILEKSYQSMKKYVDASLFWARLFSFGDHRYIWHTPAIFHFGDWVAPDVKKMSDWQKRSIYTATCSLKNTSTILSHVAAILGNADDQNKYQEIALRVDKAFNKVLTDGNGKVKKEFQTSYVLPIYFNMFNEQQKKNALERLVKLIEDNDYHIGTGFPGTPYILFALADNGYQDVAYKMLLNETCPSWLYEVKVGGTSIWERWDGLDENGNCHIEDDGTGDMISYNHYASGAVGNFLYSRLAGLRIKEPGYKKFKVQPVLCDEIKYVKTSTVTPYGEIKIEYTNKESFEIKLRVPLRSECELVLPNHEIHILKEGNHSFVVRK